MRHSLIIILAALITTTSFAEESCPLNNSTESTENCDHPEWRQPARMLDNSRVQLIDVAENTERTLPNETVTLWGLPPISMVRSQPYTDKMLQQTKLQVNSGSAQFASANAQLNPQTIKRVSALLKQLKNKRNVRLRITGHTDNQQISLKSQRWYKDNQALSTARAKAVADYFQKNLTLKNHAITVVGMGDKKPIANNTSSAGMAKNRRVEIAIWYDKIANQKKAAPSMSRRQVCANNRHLKPQLKGGFRISVDGEPVDKGNKDNENQQRCVDVALAKAAIRLQYDNLSTDTMLDVNAWPATAMVGERIKFQGSSNYMAWIDHAEVRIFAQQQSVQSEPLAIIALDTSLQGTWMLDANAPRAMQYRIRVYDDNGRFDETTSLPLTRISKHKVPKDSQLSAQQGRMIAYGKSRLEKQSIAISGGSVTVHGSGIPSGHQIVFMGKQIPVDSNGRFVARQIIPSGRHTIEVAALNENGDGELFWRDIEFKKDDWFYVGLIDVTAGRYHASRSAETVTKDRHLDNSRFIDGRLAFYTKGKWRNKYTVTASADTREERFSKLFSTFMDKDPRSLLRRLDETEYYPTYGDDSTLVEDAPTQGKFYAKIEDERSEAMWGNFKIVQQETDLAQINRGLYGAVVDWNSESITANSDNKTHVNLFAAEPGTQAAREEFRGTGGSLYYLSHQDIVKGAERIQVEVRDKDSGIVLNVNTLVAGQDYQEDAIQGKILLTRPLPSTADDSQLVRAGSYAGNPVYLVVDYEYVGKLTDFEDLAIGGRATHWLTDSLRLGLTGSHQQRSNEDQNLNGFDALYRKTNETYLRFEAARTEGPGVISNSSVDGGFNFSPTGIATSNNQSANAYQLESGFKLTDLGFEMDAKGNFYLRRRDKGFSAPGQLTTLDTSQYGGAMTMPLSDKTKVDVKFDLTHQKKGIDTETAEIDLIHKLSERWSISSGLRVDDRNDNGLLTPSNNVGNRSDLALQADYLSTEDWGVYGFAQKTLHKSEDRNKNNRAGMGGHYQLNDRLGLKGELSAGSGGLGALVGTDYRLSDRTTTYLNYSLNPDNANSGVGNRQGKLVSGIRNRYSDWVSVYGEDQFLHGDSGHGLTHAYGVDLTPNETWKFGLAIESGEITSNNSTLERRGASISADYALNDIKYGGSLEFRRDNTDGSVRKNWLTRNHLGYQVDPDWRMTLKLDLAISNSDSGNSFDADFIEMIFGYAYRPVANDKFNALLEYKYLADQAPSQQFTASGLQNDFQQRSHVFAVDGIYDITSRWSVGAKYAIRLSELRAGRGEGDWFKSTAQLGIVRADWHVVKNWDALIEARVLDIHQADDRRAGFLAALYRHLGDNLKVGVGYNFTDFSDQLTDLSYDSRGAFVNVIGKF